MYAHELPPRQESLRPIAPSVLRSACQLASAILAVPHNGPNGASLQHKKTLLARLYSFITDANGKYASPYRSKGVLEAIASGEDIVVEHEHVYTRISITELLLREPARVEEVLSTRLIACLVTELEHRALDAATKRCQVEGWARYKAAGVVVPGVPDLKHDA